MTRSTTRRLAVLLLATPLALTACSGSDSSTPNSSSAASSTTASLGDLKPGGTVDKATFFQVTKAAADGAKTYSFATQVGDAESGMTSTGVVDNTDANNRKRQITVKNDSGELQLVIANGQVYQRNAAVQGSKWTQAPVNAQLNALLTGPGDRMEQDQAVVQTITYVGEEDVNGTKTKHFTLALDPTKATAPATSATGTSSGGASAPTSAAASGSSSAAATGTSSASGTGSAGASGTASSPAAAPVTVEYWLDDANRTRKMQHSVTGVPTVTTYDKWGEPVTITVPSPDQVSSTAPGTGTASSASGSPAPAASAPTS